jgi:hypothetical protein
MASQASFVLRVIDTLRRQPLSYALGRFTHVRRLYGTARGLGQRLGFDPSEATGVVLFQGTDVEAMVRSLRARSVYVTPPLPHGIVSEIRRFAAASDCRRQGRPPTFKASDVAGGRLPTGELAVLADVVDADRNEAVRAVVDEPSVIRVASRYLGYTPTRHRARLIWSFVCDASNEVRESEGQTVTYHFDVENYNFVYANYYLTDVDARGGAHTMVVGTHDDKPLAWLLSSARRSDDEILKHYGADRELTLVGAAGFGFIQDSSCYHRALAPIDRARLMLQIRYF